MRSIGIVAGRGAFRGAGTRLFRMWVVAVAVTVGLVGTAPSPASASPAAAPAASSYRPGRDVARRVVLNASGDGGWVLDARGPVRAFGSAPGLSGAPDWGDWRIARDLVVNADGHGGYVLDGWGGIHPVGDAAPVGGSPYWAGRDLARRLVLSPAGAGGWVLDAWGGIHAFGGAPPITGGPYWRGWDIARDLAVGSGGDAFVLDGWGGVHTGAWTAVPVNVTAPAVTGINGEGTTLTATPGTWAGAAPITYSYQWYECEDADVGSCYDDLGSDASQTVDGRWPVAVMVTATNAFGSASAWSAVVESAKPALSGPWPDISGDAVVGATLTVTPTTWSGMEPITISYRWEACDSVYGGGCVTIGTDSDRVTLSAAEVGRYVRVSVTGTNPAGSEGYGTAFVGPIAAGP